MKASDKAKHRNELISSALRSAILERVLLPGMKLPEDSLGERFGVSRTLIRQALERLAAEGLVELRRNRGAMVAKPSLEEARDIFELRTQIEDLVISRVIKEMTPEKLVELEAHLAKEIEAEHASEPISIRLATEFHILLAKLAGSPVLLRYVEEIGYRCGLTLSLYARPHSTDCGIQEHRQIIDSLARGDEEKARELMRSHLTAVADRALITRKEAGPLVYLDALEPYARKVRDGQE
ncbi:GntR family transcriptional regulator [Thalassospira xianhensis]|uniref:GntR family transcriptional regulator n=1 Tax=Thalassospira xianhensis MCCC 1A02616 TaxID=1177929 RepID=A0A367U9R4_9PROT|nr:GntR family transcriptional regulator [Thalassospira xianhensis]RCK04988.1 GntR family transcriptional regulator [Thalassospira xianhensis MCCC 1A02616]